MKLHWLQHVPFEELGFIQTWAENRVAEITCTRLYNGEPLPEIDAFDLLIVMGGPMGIYDYELHPWLIPEKEFIRATLDIGTPVLGICLGAQLMADVLGANVYPGPQKEIGWFPVLRDPEAPELIPDELTVFHWHGDTFEIPDGAHKLAVSEPGINQGFVYNGNAVALQFHMETTPEGMEALIENCRHELTDAPYIQTAIEMREGCSNIRAVNKTLERLLDTLT
jgi:GMP synthase (glutamine-hydrolysing)